MKTLVFILALLIAKAQAPVVQPEKCPENLYPLSGIVTETDYNSDTVTITDCAGMTWQFYGVEDWAVGDIAACIMDDNGTELIFDDEIVKVYYAGAVENNAFWISAQ